MIDAEIIYLAFCSLFLTSREYVVAGEFVIGKPRGYSAGIGGSSEA